MQTEPKTAYRLEEDTSIKFTSCGVSADLFLEGKNKN